MFIDNVIHMDELGGNGGGVGGFHMHQFYTLKIDLRGPYIEL